MEEDKPVPEETEALPPAVERAPKRSTAPAADEPAAPIGAPAVVAPSPTAAKAKPSKAGDGHASFQIEISAPSDEVQLGGDALIVIALTNLAEHQILFAHRPGMNNPEFSYAFQVRNAAGRVVEETAYGRESRVHPETEGRTVDYVQPGQSVTQTAHLARLVNLSRPGRYTVRVSRRDPESQTVVESNEITLNVVP
jgi:hypothetical protein